MAPQIYVFSSESASQKFVIKDKFYFSYILPEPAKQFEEPHFARLLWVYPKTKTPLYICADFVQEQLIDGKRIPFIGCTDGAFQIFWAPLVINPLPTTGVIFASSCGGENLRLNLKLYVGIEIASATWLNGTAN